MAVAPADDVDRFDPRSCPSPRGFKANAEVLQFEPAPSNGLGTAALAVALGSGVWAGVFHVLVHQRSCSAARWSLGPCPLQVLSASWYLANSADLLNVGLLALIGALLVSISRDRGFCKTPTKTSSPPWIA